MRQRLYHHSHHIIVVDIFLLVLMMISLMKTSHIQAINNSNNSNNSNTSTIIDANISLNLTYYSFVTKSIRSDNTPNMVSATIRELISLRDSDDSPMEMIDLPFSFPFFGVNYGRLYVNPNGYLSAKNVQPCACDCFIDTTCAGFNSSYYGVLAGLLADWDTSKSSFANITYSWSSTKIRVFYRNVPYFSYPGVPNTFAITLSIDGSIDLNYVNTNTFPMPYAVGGLAFLSGIRLPQDSGRNYLSYAEGKQYQANKVILTSEQELIGKTNWNTNVPGIYPLRKYVSTGNKFVICPLSTSWCLTPSQFNMTDRINRPYAITLSPLSISCTEYISIGVVVSDTNSHSSLDTTNVVSCGLLSGSSPPKYICNVDAALMQFVAAANADGVSTMQLFAFIAVRVSTVTVLDGSSIYEVISTIPPVSIEIILTPPNQSPSDGECSNNINSLSFSTNSSCGLCNGNYDCLNLPCPANSAAAPNTGLYSFPDCMGSCLANSTAYWDSIQSICCATSDLDCFGRCFGTAKLGRILVPPYVTTVCCAQKDLDCTGVCRGTAKVDACGFCQGSNRECNNGDSRLQTGAPWPSFARNSVHSAVSPFSTRGTWNRNVSALQDLGESSQMHATGFTENVAWSFQACINSTSRSSPVIDNQGVIYIGCDSGYLYSYYPNSAFNTSNSKIYSVPVQKNRFNARGAIQTTPAIDKNNIIYFGTTNGIFYAVNTNTLQLSWSVRLGGCLQAPPTLYGGNVLIATGWTQRLYAYSTSTGAMSWVVDMRGNISSAPLVSRGLVYALNSYSQMLVIRLDTGSILEIFSLGTNQHANSPISAAVMLPDYSIIVGLPSGSLYSISGIVGQMQLLERPQTFGIYTITTPVLYVANFDLVVFGTSVGKLFAVNQSNPFGLVWSISIGSSISSAGALSSAEDTVIWGTDDGAVVTLSAATGILLASIDAGTAVSNIAIAADGAIIASTASGTLVRIGASFPACQNGFGVSKTMNDSTLSVSCDSCEPGFYSFQGTCTACYPGTTVDYQAASSCISCDAGWYASSFGSTDCKFCSTGKYSSSGSATCQSCAPGYAANSTGSTACQACNDGYFSSRFGSIQCTSCALGQYSTLTQAADSCAACPAGKYGSYLFVGNPNSGAGCIDCSPGTFTATSGNTICEVCPKGTSASRDGSTSCTRCSYGTYAANGDNPTVECSTCPYPYFPANNLDSDCRYLLLVPHNPLLHGEIVAVYLLFVTLIALVTIRFADIDSTRGLRINQVIVTRLGLMMLFLPNWLENMFLVFYLVYVRLKSFLILGCLCMIVVCWPLLGMAWMLQSMGVNLRTVPNKLRAIHLFVMGSILFQFRLLGLRSIWNNYFRSLTGQRNLDSTSPLVVKFINNCMYWSFLLQTLPTLILVYLNNSLQTEATSEGVVTRLLFVCLSLSSARVLLYLWYYSDYSLGTHPISITFGSWSLLLVPFEDLDMEHGVVPMPVEADNLTPVEWDDGYRALALNAPIATRIDASEAQRRRIPTAEVELTSNYRPRGTGESQRPVALAQVVEFVDLPWPANLQDLSLDDEEDDSDASEHSIDIESSSPEPVCETNAGISESIRQEQLTLNSLGPINSSSLMRLQVPSSQAGNEAQFGSTAASSVNQQLRTPSTVNSNNPNSADIVRGLEDVTDMLTLVLPVAEAVQPSVPATRLVDARSIPPIVRGRGSLNLDRSHPARDESNNRRRSTSSFER